MNHKIMFTQVLSKDFEFINELLKSRGALLAYPKCQSIEDITIELKEFENILENCLNLISYQDAIMGVTGLFYTEGDSEGIIFGPLLVPLYQTEKWMKEVLKQIDKNIPRCVSKLEAIVSSENSLLQKCLSEMNWIKKESQIQMEKLIEMRIEESSSFNIQPITQISEMVSMFHLLDEAFYWDGHTERMEELLNRGYEMACAKNKQEEVLGVISWSLINDEKVDLEYIVVNPTARRQGVGAALIHYVLNWCVAHHIKEIKLLTGVDNPAIGLYEKVGFLEVMTSTIYEKYCFVD